MAYLRIKEVAKILSVSDSTVRRLIEEGQMTIVKVGSSIRIDMADLSAYLTRNEHKAAV